MSNTYRILDGTFRDADGSVKGPGDEIELADDVAAQHAARLEQLPAAPAADAPAVAEARPAD